MHDTENAIFNLVPAAIFQPLDYLPDISCNVLCYPFPVGCDPLCHLMNDRCQGRFNCFCDTKTEPANCKFQFRLRFLQASRSLSTFFIHHAVSSRQLYILAKLTGGLLKDRE
nr:hypothetical protein [Acetobacter persici]